MGTLVNLAIPVLLLVVLGYIAAKFFHYGEGAADWLNGYVICFALPGLVFRTFAQTPFENAFNWLFVAATTLATYIILVLALCAGLLIFRERLRVAAIQAAAAGFGNAGYIGLPIAVLVLGAGAAVPACLIFLFDTLLVTIVVTALMAADRANGPQTPSPLAVLERSLLFSPVLLAGALGGAMSVSGVAMPAFFGGLLELLAQSAAPAALFALGVAMGQARLKPVEADLPFLIFVKLIAHPVLVLAILSLLGPFDMLWISVAVMMAALPASIQVPAFARQFKCFETGASNSFLAGGVLSVLTISFLLIMIDRQMLPADLIATLRALL